MDRRVDGPQARLPLYRATSLPPPVVALVVAVLAPVLALLARTLLSGEIGGDYPFVTFFVAIAVAAWAGGFGGGLIATILSGALMAVFVLRPARELVVAEPSAIAVFVVAGSVVAAVGGHLHVAFRTAEAARARAAHLARASELLSRQVDRPGTLAAVLEATIPSIADAAVVALADTGKALHVELLDEAATVFGGDIPARVRTVASDGTPDLVPRVADLSPDDDLVGPARRLGAASVLTVPIIDESARAFGAIVLVRRAGRRRFGTEDRDSASGFGARVGLALRQAQLFATVRDQARELRTVTNAIDDAVVITDAAGAITSRNRAAGETFGVSADATLDAVLRQLGPARAGSDARPVGTTGRFVVPVVVGLGGEADGRRLAIFRDVTEVLETEAARDAFVGMLSHELRTPITTIYGASRVLLKDIDELTRRTLIDDVAEEADRLYRLVEDLLVLSRFERGRLEISPEPVLVHRIVPVIAGREAARVEGMHLTLEIPGTLPAVMADATYVEQIVRNLMTNAAKYAGPSPRVFVRARMAESGVMIEVEDDGPGIPDQDRERVFALYERLTESHTYLVGGSGIGLFVCRRLVEAMGGAMSLAAAPAGGARFSFILPVASTFEADPMDSDSRPAVAGSR